MSAKKDILDMSLDEISKMNRKSNAGKFKRGGRDVGQKKHKGYHPYASDVSIYLYIF